MSKNFGFVFLNFKPKNNLNYGVLLQNYVQKQKSASLKFVTGASKKTLKCHSLAMPGIDHKISEIYNAQTLNPDLSIISEHPTK